MKQHLKSLATMALCLLGWALVPFTSLPTEVFGWELYADAYGDIFDDDFESGDLSAWSRVQGAIELVSIHQSGSFDATFRLHDGLWQDKEDSVRSLLVGRSVERLPVFNLETRRHDGHLQLRIRAFNEQVISSETPWRNVSRRYDTVRIEWQRSHPEATDGLLYLSIDGDLFLWLVDLDNSLLPLEYAELALLENTARSLEFSGGSLDYHIRGAKDEATLGDRTVSPPPAVESATSKPGRQSAAGPRTDEAGKPGRSESGGKGLRKDG